MGSYLDESLAKLEYFEGVIPWMYRDTAGKVTTGVGLMLPDAGAAAKLPFQVAGRVATEAEIAAEFTRVDGMPVGRPAVFYRGKGTPELKADDIAALLRTVLLGFESELRQRMPRYDAFPNSAKLALLDMAYNLGPMGLLEGYPKMLAAIEAGEWARAAAESFRLGPGAARNEWTRQQLLANVVKKMQASAQSGWKEIGYGLVGLGAAAVNRIRTKR